METGKSFWRGWLPNGQEILVGGRTSSEIFDEADRLGCVKLIDWHNCLAVKLSDGWFYF